MIITDEFQPPSTEHCEPDTPPSPPETLLDPSVPRYEEQIAEVFNAGAPNTAYPHVEGRLVHWLRAAAQTKDPLEILTRSALSFYLTGTIANLQQQIANLERQITEWVLSYGPPPDPALTTELDMLTTLSTPGAAVALADLAVTGRAAFTAFSEHLPQESELLDRLRKQLPAIENPPDETRLRAAVKAALDRTYNVAWALRDPNPDTRAQRRKSLGWVAVSGEDDPPHRPVNLLSEEFPQFDIQVVCPAPLTPVSPQKTILVETRYMIALPQQSFPIDIPSDPIRRLPNTWEPSIPDDHEVILFIPGSDSDLEEAHDLVPKLHDSGLERCKKYAIIAIDLPSNGYSQMIDHSVIAPSDATHFNVLPPNFLASAGLGGGLGAALGIFPDLTAAVSLASITSILQAATKQQATYPLLDFLMEFVISFINALDRKVHIKDRMAAVIGGSLGGNLCLRLGEHTADPGCTDDWAWIRNLVAWSPGSVWPSFNQDTGDPGSTFNNWVALWGTFERMQQAENEDPPSRISFFYEVFDSALGKDVPQQPKTWYWKDWTCINPVIHADRIGRQEIYNAVFRRWHWRVDLEELLFSHFSTDTPDKRPRYAYNHTNTLLIAGKADDYPHAQIYSNTINLAQKMKDYNNPGNTFFLKDTGHSICNQRPMLLAQRIVEFIQPFPAIVGKVTDTQGAPIKGATVTAYLTGYSGHTIANLQQQITNLQQQIANLQQQIANLNQRLTEWVLSYGPPPDPALVTQLADLNTQLAPLSTELATLTTSGAADPRSVTTDDTGCYNISVLSRCDYNVTASASLFASGHANVAVMDGVLTTPQNFQLVPYTITVTVTDTGGSPIKGATVLIKSSYGPLSRDKDVYTSQPVPAGDYDVSARKLGFVDSDPRVVTVPGPSSSALTVEVTDTQGSPINDATVLIKSRSYIQLSEVQPGIYTSQPVLPGNYDIFTKLLGFMDRDTSITVKDGVPMTTTIIPLVSIIPITITGKVTDTKCTPIQGATVTASSAVGSGSATTDATGSYNITNLAPGVYAVTVAPSGFVSNEINIVIPNGATATQNFTLIKEGSLTGMVAGETTERGQGGKLVTSAGPLSGATVTASSAAGSWSAKTDAAGSYIIMLPPGVYNVTADATGYQMQYTEDNQGNIISVTINATVTEGGTTSQDIQLVAPLQVGGGGQDGGGKGGGHRRK